MGPAYGLIGKSLTHSFSKNYFEQKFRELNRQELRYTNYELSRIEELPELLRTEKELKGLNVTLPFKESVIPFLDRLSEEASAIGAVNCIDIRNGIKTGYNTDVFGFSQSIKPFLDKNHEKALILGTGGSSKAVAYALKQIGIDYWFVSSDPQKKSDTVLLYSEVNALLIQNCKLIVNCTPLGMFPDVNSFPELPYSALSSEHLVYDLVYNPEQSILLKKAAGQNAICVNGLNMLKMQAEKSWEIWNQL